MPNLTVEGIGTFPIPENKRLVLALEDEAHIDQLHACGGNARCTTCDHDMTVRVISRLAGSGRLDAGKRPTDDLQPQPVEWIS